MRMTNRSMSGRLLIACATVWAASATGCLWQPCNGLGPYAVLTAGIQVNLLDAETGEPIQRARVIASDGEYRTYLLPDPYGSGWWGSYRPGTYTIEVYVDGYAPILREGVVVEPYVSPGANCPIPMHVMVEITMQRE